MTPEQLKAIRARLDAATPGNRAAEIFDHAVFIKASEQEATLIAHAPTDLRALLDEVERLKAREESLVQQSVAQIGLSGRLQKEVERLRDALEDIASGDYSDPLCMKTPEARARAALEIK
jgi:hypothetical protein